MQTTTRQFVLVGATALLVAGAATVGSVPATAALINYTLQDVTFGDGGTATGSFTADPATGAIESVAIVTTPGTLLGGYGYAYPDASNTIYQGSPFAGTTNSFLIQDANTNYLTLSFLDSLTTLGADPILVTPGPFGVGESFECDNCGTLRAVTGGFAFGSLAMAVPEPLSAALLATGLLGLGLVRRR